MRYFKFTFLLLTISFYANAQSPEKVIGHYFKAIGGLDNWKKVETIEIKRHSIEKGNWSFIERLFVLNGKGWRSESVVGQGSPSVMAVYEGKGREVNNLAGNLGAKSDGSRKKPISDMPDSTIKILQQRKYTLHNLANYQSKDVSLSLLGEFDNINGEKAIGIKIVSDDIENDYFFSRKTHYLLRIKSGDRETNYFKYKDVENLKYPFEIEARRYNTMHPHSNKTFTAIVTYEIDEVILNPKFEESIFLKPKN